MLIGTLGEFGLIERITKAYKLDASVIRGAGDDCAVVEFDKNRFMLLTSDMLVEGVDFTIAAKPYLIGRKALAVSLSDIAACAGIPRYALVSVGLPKKTSVAFVDSLMKGIRDLAKAYGVNIVGGDLSRAERLTFDVGVVGFVEKKYLLLRSGAKAGDRIFATGALGGSIAGRHFTFTPRVREARYLAQHFKLHAMIDISDGLAQDLGHILIASNVGATLYEALIPLGRDARTVEDALYMGEDFELLFTVPPKEAKRLLKKKLPFCKPLGEIVDKSRGMILVTTDNRQARIKPRGFCHF